MAYRRRQLRKLDPEQERRRQVILDTFGVTAEEMANKDLRGELARRTMWLPHELVMLASRLAHEAQVSDAAMLYAIVRTTIPRVRRLVETIKSI